MLYNKPHKGNVTSLTSLTFEVTMMKPLFSLFFLLVLAASQTLCAAGAADEVYPPLGDTEKKQFYEKLEAEIAKSRQEFTRLTKPMKGVSSPDLKAFRARSEFVSAQLMTKEILFKNFYETPSIQSPLVRNELLHLFSNGEITQAELSQLKTLVASEKLKMQKQSTQLQQFK